MHFGTWSASVRLTTMTRSLLFVSTTPLLIGAALFPRAGAGRRAEGRGGEGGRRGGGVRKERERVLIHPRPGIRISGCGLWNPSLGIRVVRHGGGAERGAGAGWGGRGKLAAQRAI